MKSKLSGRKRKGRKDGFTQRVSGLTNIKNKKILACIAIVAGILLTVVYRVNMTGRFAENEYETSDFDGRILSVTQDNPNPKIIENLNFTTAVENTGNEKNDYLLDFKIVKNGIIKYSDEISFSLLPTKTVSLSIDYNPDEVGFHEIFARLYDANNKKMYDEKNLHTLVQSDVGPFDLEVDMPSNIIGIGDPLLVSMNIKNVGIASTDVYVKMEVACPNGDKVTNDFYIFVNKSSYATKQMILRTCGVAGLHTLTASLMLYENVLLVSKRQFVVNENMPKVTMTVQDSIKAGRGENAIFGIEVTNPNDFELKNIRPFIYNMPQEWLLIEPTSFSLLKQNEMAVFKATISIPKNAEIKNYALEVGIGGDNVFYRKSATLTVGTAVLASFVSNISFAGSLPSSYLIIILAIAIIISIYMFNKYRKKSM